MPDSRVETRRSEKDLTLTRLVTGVGLVNDVNTALTTDKLVVLVAGLQGLQRR